MNKYTFEDFLMEKHAEQYVGTKDCMVDDFNEWVLELGLDIDEVIKYADEFQKQINAELLEVLKDWERNIPRMKDATPGEDSLRARALRAIAKAEDR